MNEAENAQILAEEEHEFSSEQIIRIGGEYFHRRQNGGQRGAWDSRNLPSGKFGTVEISRTEARAMLLALDKEPAEVAELTK